MENFSQATDDKHLILEDQFEGRANTTRPPLHSERYDFWTNRYLCIPGIHDHEFWHFDIFDFLTNDSKPVRFQKSFNRFQDVDTYFLNCKFMLIAESNNRFLNAGSYRVSLVKLNWESGIFEELEHFERNSFFCHIVVDPLNQSTFVLRFLGDQSFKYQECKLVNSKIEYGSVHSLFDRYSECSSGKLIEVTRLDRKFRIKEYNMIDKQEKTFETETIPGHVEFVDNLSRTWIGDCLYAAIWFQDSRSYGLMWADAQTRRWNILDFSSILRPRRLHFFNDKLIVRTEQAGTENRVFKSDVKFYEISIHRPQSLRQKAWLCVIRNLKSKGHPNPYKEARKYLPLNTDLRPHWFDDVEEEAPAKQADEQGNDVGDEAVQVKFADLSI